MAKTKGKKINKNDKRNKNESESDSDKYANDDDFDPKNPFDNDEIESFHAGRDKVLLDSLGPKKKKDFQYSSEEEVLAFDDEDSSDEDEEYDGKVYGDDDEDEEEDGKNDEEFNEYTSSWGQKKSAYYSGNKIENDEDAELEEAEAKALQEKMMKQLDTNDFDLDAFKVFATTKGKALKTGDEINAKKLALNTLGDLERDDDLNEEKLKKIAKNLDKMTKKEKLDFLQQESPELFELVRDFKEKLSELQDTLMPIFKCIKSGQLPHSSANEFIINKTKLYLMYCSHLCFYFVLKSQRQPVENHPIVKNILQYRNLTKQINSIDEKLEKEIKFIVSSIRNNKQISFVKSTKPIKKVNFKLRPSSAIKKSIEDDTDSEMEMNMVHEEEKEIAESTPANDKMDKRAINYQIEKNKGLTPKRNKKYRNPRVVNRIKAHKAIVKRKSIVPVRTQDKRYSGEATGIRTSVVRGVKIK